MVVEEGGRMEGRLCARRMEGRAFMVSQLVGLCREEKRKRGTFELFLNKIR